MNNDREIKRVRRSKEAARSSYNSMSRYYDLLTGCAEKRYADTGLEKLAALRGEKILEIGFATGRCLVSIAGAVGPEGRVYGIDISDGMCQKAGKRLADSGLSPRVDISRGDALKLPYETASFDAVFSSFTLELFDTPEIPLVLAECYRVLKDSGRIVIAGMTKTGKTGNMLKLYEMIHDRYPSLIDCRPVFLRESIESAGFRCKDETVMRMFGLPVAIITAGK